MERFLVTIDMGTVVVVLSLFCMCLLGWLIRQDREIKDLRKTVSEHYDHTVELDRAIGVFKGDLRDLNNKVDVSTKRSIDFRELLITVRDGIYDKKDILREFMDRVVDLDRVQKRFEEVASTDGKYREMVASDIKDFRKFMEAFAGPYSSGYNAIPLADGFVAVMVNGHYEIIKRPEDVNNALCRKELSIELSAPVDVQEFAKELEKMSKNETQALGSCV